MGGSAQRGNDMAGSPVNGNVVESSASKEDKLTSGSSQPDKMVVGSPLLPDKVITGSSVTGEVVAGSSHSLAEFYEAIADDVRIGPTHICLYVALLNEWDMAFANDAIALDRNVLMKKDSILLDRNAVMKKNSILLDKNVLMKNARISRRTYHKCMRELHEYGYIRYEPSSNPCLKSRVYLKRL